MATQTVAGLVTIWENGSISKFGHRIGEGDLNTELLTAWIKGFKYRIG